MIFLSAADVRATITMTEAIDAVRHGFIALSNHSASVPVRGVLTTPNGVTLTMPAFLPDERPITTVKVVSVYPDNRIEKIPVVNAVVMVLDATNGLPIALLDGTSLTAIRTGAASGLATELLANPKATVLGVIGAGPQARMQIEAVCAVRPIQEIRIYSPTRAPDLALELSESHGLNIIAAENPHAALDGADVIVAATNSKTPVVHAADVGRGVHINGVGSFTPEMQEIAAEVVTGAKIVVDHRESAWAEAGDLIIPRDAGIISEADVYAEIGEIAAGLVQGRSNHDEITFFKSVGNAIQDAAVAARILKAAEERGLGSMIEL